MSRKIIRSVESGLDRLAGRDMNPSPQAGALTFLLCVTLLVSGAALFTYYSVEPEDTYLSVKYLTDETFIGYMARGVHRHAADLVLALAAAHMLRTFFLGRGSGPRRMSWISGVALLFFLIYQGITGYILPWDERSQAIIQSVSGAADHLPFTDEPLSRHFLLNSGVATRTMIYLLASHLVPPVMAAGLFWIHFRRIHRPRVWPDARLTTAVLAGLAAAAAIVPAESLRPADFSRITGAAPFDWAHLFPLPLMSSAGPAAFWGLAAGAFVLLAAAPALAAWGKKTSVVSLSEDRCVGCALCEADCPCMAMEMQARPLESRYPWLVSIKKERCVGCGVCVGSCGFGALRMPGGIDGDMRARAAEFLLSRQRSKPVVVYACANALNGDPGARMIIEDENVFFAPLICAGELYTGWIEEDLKNGAAGAVVARCSPSRCEGREGAAFAETRIFHDRKPWLKKRVGHGRVRLVTGADAEAVSNAVRALRDRGEEPGEKRNGTAAGRAFAVIAGIAALLFAMAADGLWRHFTRALDDGSAGRVIVSADCGRPCRLELSADGETRFEKNYGAVKMVEKIGVEPGTMNISVTLTDSETMRPRRTAIAGPIEAGRVIVVRENMDTGGLEAVYDPRNDLS